MPPKIDPASGHGVDLGGLAQTVKMIVDRAGAFAAGGRISTERDKAKY
jgi:hypothetical protein